MLNLLGLLARETAVGSTACKYTGKSEITRTLTDHRSQITDDDMIRKRIYFQDFESNSKKKFIKSCEAVFQQGVLSPAFFHPRSFCCSQEERGTH